MMEEKIKEGNISIANSANLTIPINNSNGNTVYAYKNNSGADETISITLANKNNISLSGWKSDNIIDMDESVYVHEVHVKSIKNNTIVDNYPTIASLVANNTVSGKWTYIAPIGFTPEGTAEGTSTNYKLGLYPIEKYQYYRVIVSEIVNNNDFNLTVTLKGGALTNEIKPYGSHYEHFTPIQRNRSVSFDESKNEIISHENEDDNSLQYSEWIIPSILVGALSVAFFTKK